VEIATPRLVLRPFRRGDEGDLVAVAGDRRVSIHLLDRFPHPYTVEDAEQWLAHVGASSPASDLAITLDGRLIGGVGVERRGDVWRFGGELGYWIGAAHWGHGYASEAVGAFVSYAFATFGLERIEARVFAPNLSSRRVLEKCGFRVEGVLRRAAFKEGRFLDAALFARLRGDP
jgi:RimJ/RimL family protein N-acetyltransferase